MRDLYFEEYPPVQTAIVEGEEFNEVSVPKRAGSTLNSQLNKQSIISQTNRGGGTVAVPERQQSYLVPNLDSPHMNRDTF